MSKHSPKTGDEPDHKVAFEFTAGRWRHATWAIVFVVLALFFAWRIGGTWSFAVGVMLGIAASHHATTFVRSFARPPGGIRIEGSDLVVTPRLHAPEVRLPLTDVRSAYIVRRTSLMVASVHMLVLETAKGTFEYPREWFGADGDQRRVATALGRALGYL